MKKVFKNIGLLFFLLFFVLSFKAQAQTEPDAIAVRILPNPNNYSIQEWYNLQGFTGSPQAIIVDGWKGVRDGRTVYISAANVDISSEKVYFNIYIISYNQDADNSTVDIFGRILQNWKLNSNLKQYIGTCSVSTLVCANNSDCPSGYSCGGDVNGLGNIVGESYQKNKCIVNEDDYTDLINTPSCILDSECSSNLFCDSFQASLIRDTDRMEKIYSMETRLESYKGLNNKYPVLQSGTYIPHVAVSTWPSWQSVFLNQIGSSSMVDPINRLGSCYNLNASFDLLTCWDALRTVFSRIDSPVNYLNFSLPSYSKVLSYVSNPSGSSYKINTYFETLLHEGIDLSWPNEKLSSYYLPNFSDDSSIALVLEKNMSVAGSVTSSPAGINCGETCNLTSSVYPVGTQITLTATPKVGYIFTGWSGGGCSGVGTCQVTISDAVKVIAEFEQEIPNFNFSVSAVNGSIFCNDTSCASSYPEGTVVNLTTNPNSGYVFKDWIEDCFSYGTNNTCTITIDNDKSVGANFGFDIEKGFFTDSRDGTVYEWVRINSKRWMAENLNIASEHIEGERFCYDDDTPNYCDIYGGLYNQVVTTGGVYSNLYPSGIQGICPEGWHIPSVSEWGTLFTYLSVEGNSGPGTASAGKIKSERTDPDPVPSWSAPNVSGNSVLNSSGFNVLPGGSYFDDHNWTYNGSGSASRVWSSTSQNGYFIGSATQSVGAPHSSYTSSDTYLSVRCVED